MIPISELDLVNIGEIVKAHGYKGELVIKFSNNFYDLDETEPIFLEIEGILVPFFFSYSPKPFKQTNIIAKLDLLNSDEEVKELIKCQVFAESLHLSHTEEDIYDTVFAYDVFDNETLIGKAGEYLNIPSNPILTVIDTSNNEILIPINEQFLVKIDKEKKQIIFNLPPGLIDVNL